jgi:hypothetical protein
MGDETAVMKREQHTSKTSPNIIKYYKPIKWYKQEATVYRDSVVCRACGV